MQDFWIGAFNPLLLACLMEKMQIGDTWRQTHVLGLQGGGIPPDFDCVVLNSGLEVIALQRWYFFQQTKQLGRLPLFQDKQSCVKVYCPYLIVPPPHCLMWHQNTTIDWHTGLVQYQTSMPIESSLGEKKKPRTGCRRPLPHQFGSGDMENSGIWATGKELVESVLGNGLAMGRINARLFLCIVLYSGTLLLPQNVVEKEVV